MKISNETKVGILTITALTLLILGFNYLKGKDIFTKVRAVLDTLTTTLNGVNGVLSVEARLDLRHTFQSLNQASNALNGLLNNETGALARSLENTRAITENFRRNNDSITAMISNAKRVTEKLAALELQQTVDSLQSAVTLMKATISKVTSPNGSLGAFIS